MTWQDTRIKAAEWVKGIFNAFLQALVVRAITTRIKTTEWLKDIFNAFVEAFVVLAITNFNFIILFISSLMTTKQAGLDKQSVISGVNKVSTSIAASEILAYLAALLGGIIYWYIRSLWTARSKTDVGLALLFIFAPILLLVLSTPIFTSAHTGVKLNDANVLEIARWFYAIALLLWYGGLLFQRRLERRKPDPTGSADILVAKLQGDVA